MTDRYKEWRDFYAEKVRSWMSLEELRAECCKPDEHLHADRLTPKEWGGWWARIETPDAEVTGAAPEKGLSE